MEDDPDEVFLMERALASVCPRVELHRVEDGEQAIAVLSDRTRLRPTHVLLDLKLRSLSGLEVLRWVRTRPELATIPIVVLTSSAQEKDVEEAMRLGAQAYHIKPVSYPALVALVRSILATWGIEQLQGQEFSTG